MAARYEVEVTVVSARNLKNVNWKNGDLMPYAALWVDSSSKCSTKVAVDGDDDDPVWDEKLVIALPGFDRRSDLNDAVLYIDIVHANAKSDVKPLVGSARLPLAEVVDEVGLGVKVDRTLKLKRPSGRPQGKLEIRICVRETTSRYYGSAPYGAPPYGQQQRDPYGQPYGYAPPPPVGYPYGAPPPAGGYPYGAPPPPGGYAYGAQPPSGYPYGGAAPPVYGQGGPSYGAATGDKKQSKFGMGTGLAVGAAAGVLGGLALAEGIDYVEDKIADDVAERVEDDLGYDDGDY